MLSDHCARCGAEIVYSATPPHKMLDVLTDVVTTYCDPCMEDIVLALWPEELGPYPHTMHQKAGRA